eukprot:8429310-Prorocentrum_lima.AAC.1
MGHSSTLVSRHCGHCCSAFSAYILGKGSHTTNQGGNKYSTNESGTAPGWIETANGGKHFHTHGV